VPAGGYPRPGSTYTKGRVWGRSGSKGSVHTYNMYLFLCTIRLYVVCKLCIGVELALNTGLSCGVSVFEQRVWF
jgi:hypothetical protein